MSTAQQFKELADQKYRYGFVTEIEEDRVPKGLSEDIIRLISEKKGEPRFMLDWRLKAYRHWLTMQEPTWPNVRYPEIDYQDIVYYSAPKQQKPLGSMDEVDPELRSAFQKLGIPLEEQMRLAGVAVDAVFDSVSVATTYKKKLGDLGIVFCSFSEAVREHPDLVEKWLGSVVPYTDNYFATLNSAVFSDGSFVYVPKGVRCPMELSTYFRINAKDTGQFERTLIVADEGAYVSYLEGCTAPMRDENQLHAAVVELVALDGAQIKYSTVQNWYPGDAEGRGRHLQLRHQAREGDAQGEDQLDPGRDRLGHHLEVPVLHPPGRRVGGRVLLGRAHEPPPAGRHRHEDDPHRPEHPLDHHLEGDQRRPRAEHLPRAGEDAEGRAGGPQLLAVRLAPHRRSLRRPHVPVHRGPQSLPRRSSTRRPPRRSARTSSSTAGSAACRRRTRSR